jgi:hypothetical protein
MSPFPELTVINCGDSVRSEDMLLTWTLGEFTFFGPRLRTEPWHASGFPLSDSHPLVHHTQARGDSVSHGMVELRVAIWHIETRAPYLVGWISVSPTLSQRLERDGEIMWIGHAADEPSFRLSSRTSSGVCSECSLPGF